MPAETTPPIVPDDPPPSPARPRRTGRWWVLGVFVVLLVVGAWYYRAHEGEGVAAPTVAGQGGAANGKGEAANRGAPGGGFGGGRRGGDTRTVMPVTVVPARSQDFPVYQNAIGNVTARSTVTVRPRVDGQLARVLFQEGHIVKAGDLLAEIDPRPFEVQLTQANGQQARDQAQLANARIDLERYQTLFKQDSIAQQQVDTQAALVRQLEGTVEADRGAVENAKLQLSYTRITAPAGGRLGLRQVDAGNMVRQTDTNGIVVITQIQPIAVVYSIPEDRLAAVLKRSRAGEPIPVDAYDRDGKTKIETGKLLTVDNQIDPTTGTIKLKAEFANANGALFPNQFVNVRMLVDVLRNATVVPTAAVQRGNQGTFVYRVNDDDTVSVRPVKVGPAQGEITVIDEGIAPGERVVTDGTDKLRDGAKIEPVTPGAPAAGAGPGRARQGAGGPGGAGRRNRADKSGGAAAGGVSGGPGSAVPAAPTGAAPAGNSPATNGPGPGSPQTPARVQGSPNG
ncbi:MAG TPA: MdtA/MuxA family multidrug efflux RND transporter periplasmic adaptor subunit [Casimicrobiaceae bacterium]|nr:MdtA/MuxA family multidrug efflux RND transporter periplasmic adaptor subunit [Casimicrobiaceae bacterium]